MTCMMRPTVDAGLAVPNLRHLRILQTVGRLQSISRASETMNISQPALSQAIAKLEAELGAPLFERCASGSYLTEIGGIFVARVERFFEALDTAIDDLQRQPKGADDRRRRPAEQIITSTQIRSLIAMTDPRGCEEMARALGISSGSLYRSVRDLERNLMRPLFGGSANGPVINAAGAELARQFRLALQEIEYGRTELELAKGASRALVTVGMLPMSGSVPLARATADLTATYPSVRVKIIGGVYYELLRALRSGRIDMIFGILRRPDWAQDVVEEALFEDSFRVICRPRHPLAGAGRLTCERLSKYSWIVPAEGTPRRYEIDKLFEDGIGSPRLAVETSSLAAIRALVAESDMITIMSRSEIDLDEASGSFVSLPLPLGGNPRKKGITTREGWLPTAVHCRFIELLRRHTDTFQARGMARSA